MKRHLSSRALLLAAFLFIASSSFAEVGACKISNFSQVSARATVMNPGNLLQNDGLGDYIDDRQFADVNLFYALNVFPFRSTKPHATPTRSLIVDLSHPIPGGGGTPMGTFRAYSGIHTYWYLDANKLVHSVQEIPVGTNTYSELTAFFFTNPADGKPYILQMGPWSWSTCEDTGWVETAGSTRALITRTGAKTWNATAPSGSIGMVSEISDAAHPVPVGLYFFSFSINYTLIK
jgi:hypothetical protein